MVRLSLVTSHLAVAAAITSRGRMQVQLRGAEPEKAEAKNVTVDPKIGNATSAPKLPKGHFYRSDECSDCFYKAPQCGCEPVLEYFACMTKHCGSSNATEFADKCNALSAKCSGDLDVQCKGPETTCFSKFNQLPTGGIGFNLDVVEEDAFCGPFGKCLGHITLKATVHQPTVEKKDEAPASPAPALPPAIPAAPVAAASPAPGPVAAPIAAPASAPAAPTEFLECGLPKKQGADIDKKEDWTICTSGAVSDQAKCRIDLPSEFIKANEKAKMYCVLKDVAGKRLTSVHYHEISNSHKNAKVEEKKVEKAVKTTEGSSDFGKPPWMVDQEERAARQAAKKVEVEKAKAKAKEAEEAAAKKKAEKAAAKKAAGEHPSGLPWMDGKAPPAPIA